MKSIQTKFIALILTGILSLAVIIGGASISRTNKVLEADSTRIMRLLCSEKAKEFDGVLKNIQQSVETLSVYALEQLDSEERLATDEAFRQDYTEQLRALGVNAAGNTEGVVAVYVRYAPELVNGNAGFFYEKNHENGNFEERTLTDLSKFEKDDVEHVGWYYIPVEEKKTVWLAPYYNKNIDVYMISYVVPLMVDGKVIGVVGMDINFNDITEQIEQMKIYEHGYAFLTDKDGKIMHHHSLPYGTDMETQGGSLMEISSKLASESNEMKLFDYEYQGQKKKLIFTSLSNDMKLMITIPTKELNAEKNQLMSFIINATIVIILLYLFLTVIVTRQIIKPLRELNAAAQKIANGDLSVNLTCKTKDEVGMLTESFRQTATHLKKQIDYINDLAYRDALTGLNNKLAYQRKVAQLEEKMRERQADFAVLVFDVNGLKMVNDHYGHECGDLLIYKASFLIGTVFGRGSVYRIGGDEFAAILEQTDLAQCNLLLRQFNRMLESDNADEEVAIGEERKRMYVHVRVAAGAAVYHPDEDTKFGDVFRKADAAMYNRKAGMEKSIVTDF